MIKENRVSLWVGYFHSEDDFKKYTEGTYDDDGNYHMSDFQRDFCIARYDCDFAEMDWIEEPVHSTEELLSGVTKDYEITPRFDVLLKGTDLNLVNCIILLYHFDYRDNQTSKSLVEFIGAVDVSL